MANATKLQTTPGPATIAAYYAHHMRRFQRRFWLEIGLAVVVQFNGHVGTADQPTVVELVAAAGEFIGTKGGF